MGWGYKKSWRLGIPGLSRWVHVRQNATHKGLSSFSVKFFFLGWNSRTGFRFDGPGGIYWTPKRGKGKASAKGKTSAGKADGPRNPVAVLLGWPFRWAARGARWGRRQTVARTRGYYHQITAPGRMRAEHVRRHGRVPVVVDLTTEELVSTPARDAHLPDPVGGDPRFRAAGERAWREQWVGDDTARVAHAMRPQRLTWLERWQLRARGEDPQAWEDRSDAIQAAVTTRRLERLAWATDGRHHQHIQPDPTKIPSRPVLEPVPAAPVEPTVGGDMANPVRTLLDLADPGIDEHEFQTELPEHLKAAASAARERATQLDDEADQLTREADAARAYAAYMEACEVDSSIVAELETAASALEAAAQSRRGVAEEVSSAADNYDSAARAAEAEYSGMKPPRFDKAS